jgi:hypothetical protein
MNVVVDENSIIGWIYLTENLLGGQLPPILWRWYIGLLSPKKKKNEKKNKSDMYYQGNLHEFLWLLGQVMGQGPKIIGKMTWCCVKFLDGARRKMNCSSTSSVGLRPSRSIVFTRSRATAFFDSTEQAPSSLSLHEIPAGQPHPVS